jgi:aspartyl-tRNA(Asn)/glutamyl-tRNA(Gln) amidotransferase subunit C
VIFLYIKGFKIMSAITEKEVEHIAGLARIKLTEKEKEKMTKELGAILGYIDKLKEVNTEGIEPVAHITGLINVSRGDDSPKEPDSENIRRLIEQAPSKKNGYVKVKSVFKD